MQASAEREPAKGRQLHPQAPQGSNKAQRYGPGPGRGGGSAGFGQVRGRGGGRGGGRDRQAQMMVLQTDPVQQQPQIAPVLAIMAAPQGQGHHSKRAVDLAARINQTWPTNYLEGPNRPMQARTICLMRIDVHCPRCHLPDHIDVDKQGRSLCGRAIASDWPSGPYAGRIKFDRALPSRGALEATAFLKL